MSSRTFVEPVAEILDDGRLKTPRHEHFACLLADEISMADAWRATGGENVGESVKYRAKLLKKPNIIARIATLKAEKALLELDKAYGEVEWQTNQAYRIALATNELKVMMEAVQLRFKLATQKAAAIERITGGDAPPAPTGDEEEPAQAQVGRPRATGKRGMRNPDDLRKALIHRGVRMEPAAVEEDA